MLSTVGRQINKFNYFRGTPLKKTPKIHSSSNLHTLFGDKSFEDILQLIKNQKNPYPKNSAYYSALFEGIIV
jgi:hypothetical protein